jgi:hypothetical protein
MNCGKSGRRDLRNSMIEDGTGETRIGVANACDSRDTKIDMCGEYSGLCVTRTIASPV